MSSLTIEKALTIGPLEEMMISTRYNEIAWLCYISTKDLHKRQAN